MSSKVHAHELVAYQADCRDRSQKARELRYSTASNYSTEHLRANSPRLWSLFTIRHQRSVLLKNERDSIITTTKRTA